VAKIAKLHTNSQTISFGRNEVVGQDQTKPNEMVWFGAFYFFFTTTSFRPNEMVWLLVWLIKDLFRTVLYQMKWFV